MGRKYSPSPQGEGLFRNEDRQMKKTGFYIIKDKFFEDMPDPYLKGNKAGNRPHYYCLEDTSTGIYWMIPLSSRIDKYRRIMEKKKKREILRHSSYRQTGRQPGERISDTRYVSDNRRIHRTGIYNRRKSSDVDE